jgi:hypothetical protein
MGFSFGFIKGIIPLLLASGRLRAALPTFRSGTSLPPQGRNGKHKEIATKIHSDLDQLREGVALKVPLVELAEGKERVRAALNRATQPRHKTMRHAIPKHSPIESDHAHRKNAIQLFT